MDKTLPAPVAGFIRATNEHDSGALLAVFRDDAVLYNADEGTYTGIGEIKRWDDKEYIGAHCTVEVTKVITTGRGEVIVTGDVSGDFPGNRIVLYFLFTLDGDEIAALTIHS